MKVRRSQHHQFIIPTDDAELRFRFDRGHRATDVFEKDSDIVIAMLLFIQTTWVQFQTPSCIGIRCIHRWEWLRLKTRRIRIIDVRRKITEEERLTRWRGAVRATYLMIHKCENEHKCRSVREDESDSEKVRLWLCRIDDDALDEGAEAVDALAVVVVLAPGLEDELAVADDRLLSMMIAEKRKQRVFLDDVLHNILWVHRLTYWTSKRSRKRCLSTNVLWIQCSKKNNSTISLSKKDYRVGMNERTMDGHALTWLRRGKCSDWNWLSPDRCNPIAECIQRHSKYRPEWLLHVFYQVPDKQENLEEDKTHIESRCSSAHHSLFDCSLRRSSSYCQQRSVH